MTSATCSKCGAPLKPGGLFCAYCGTAVTAPLPSGAMGASRPSSPPPPLLTGTPAPASARRKAVAIAIVLVILVGAGIGSYVYLASAQTVQVNVFVAFAPNDVCGLRTNPTEFHPGFTDRPGGTDLFEFRVPNYNVTGSCTVRGVTTNTSGFSFSDAQVPLTIPAATLAGPGEAYLNLTVHLPGSSYSGSLNLIFT